MMRPGLCVLGVLVTLLGASTDAAEQRSGAVLVDLSLTEPGEEPGGFTFWRTGEGTAGKWAIVGRCDGAERPSACAAQQRPN
jgi:hypothetical protein